MVLEPIAISGNYESALFVRWRETVKDLQDRVDKLRLDAIDCDLIAKLATDDEKRKAFEYLANEYRAMATALEEVIATKIGNQIQTMTRVSPSDRRRTS